MKAACLLTDSTYALAVSDRDGMGMDVLGSGFTSTREGAGGDGIAGAGSTGRGRVPETVVGTVTGVSGIVVGTKTGVFGFVVGIETGVSETVVGMEAGVGTSSDCALPASLVLASDPGACYSLDSVYSWLVLKVVGVWRFYSTSVGGRSGNSVRS